MKNLQNHRVPNTLTFEENAIIWYRSLLLNQAHTDDMTGFDTGILIVYRMCPPVELMQYCQMDPATQLTHFMRGTHTEVWGDDAFEVMHTTAADWETMTALRPRNFSLSFFHIFSVTLLVRCNKLNIVSDDFNQSIYTLV